MASSDPSALWKSQNNHGIHVIAAEDSEYEIPKHSAIVGDDFNKPSNHTGFIPWVTEDGLVQECQRCLCKVRQICVVNVAVLRKSMSVSGCALL